MPISLRLFASTAALACIALAARPTHAQQRASDPERLFDEATALAEHGNFKEACPKFEESQRLDPAVGTQFNLALCYEKLGRLGSAWRNFEVVERMAHATGKASRAESAREKLDALRPIVPHLAIRTAEHDVTLRIDGQFVATDSWAFYPVDPGDHTIDATAPTKKPWHGSVTVAAEAKGVELGVTIPTLAAVEGKTKVVTLERSNTKRTVGFVVGGVGLVGVATAIVTGVVVLDAKATADADCTPTCATQGGRDAVALGKTLLPINAVAWGVGIAGIGVGAALLLLSLPHKHPNPMAAFLPVITADSAGLAVVGRF